MPELPEVEVLVRHLDPLLRGRVIHELQVNRPKVVRPDSEARLRMALRGAKFAKVSRRGKYLLFDLRAGKREVRLVGHLGMTGRMFVQSKAKPLPKHTAVVMELGRDRFIFEDTRYFGRLTLSQSAVNALGPEPLDYVTAPDGFVHSVASSRRSIKVVLLDQAVVAGVGNIYASEALHAARMAPKRIAARLKADEIIRLWAAIRTVLEEAVRFGSTIPLGLDGNGTKDGLFYYGSPEGAGDFYEECLRVYDRAGEPCRVCGNGIRRIVQAARSTYYCACCQR